MSMETKGQTIAERFQAVVAENPDRICVYDDNASLSYRALERASGGVAASLAAAGILPGERVALICPNGVDFVEAYLGILLAGASVVPLNLLLSPVEMAYILADSNVRAVIHHQGFEEVAKRACDGMDLALRVRIGPAGGEARAFADLVESGGQPPDLELDPGEDVAAILYTSGTTGRPKGAMLTHANLVANTKSVVQALGVRAEDRILVVLPMFHVFAATVGILTPLLHGASLVPVARFEPKLVTKAVADHQATLFLGVPSMYAVLLRLDEAALADWSSLRFCVSGGAAMPEAVLSAFESRFGVPILEGDGPTECSPVTCVNPPDGVRKPGSVGPPVPGVEMRICDAAGNTLPNGTPGEVCVRGPSVMKGYLNQSEATAEAFFGEWFRTGDLGTRDDDGYFQLVDRIKDLIIVNGMNVYPRVIEEVLYAHPVVGEAAVVGEPDSRHGEIVVAHLAAKPDVELDVAALKAWCRERLGRHEQPRRFEIHPSLPKNASGKILKRELRRAGEHERGVVSASLDQGG